MVPFPRERIKRLVVIMLLILCLAVGGDSAKRNQLQVTTEEHMEEACPPCDILFAKLQRNGTDGKLFQDVRVQERGEPKSGTTVTYSWASAALIHACDYLQELFGQGSCWMEYTRGRDGHDVGPLSELSTRMMIFEPSLGNSNSRCSCDTIDRVSITTDVFGKHRLPVNDGCAFSHSSTIAVGKHFRQGHPSAPPCTFPNGTHVNNYEELWRCMHEADCDITDDWLQMAVLRDPRLTVVSTFYHLHLGRIHERTSSVGTVDTFVTEELPTMCQWLAVRYILFCDILADQSVDFWYNDTLADPLGWHYRWFYTIGLQLPFHIVEATAQAAVDDQMDFHRAGVNPHPGENASTEGGVRLFEDEVSPETVQLADSVLRKWLPPVLLDRFGVGP